MGIFRRWAGRNRPQRLFELEALEDRVYLSLAPSIAGTLPTSLIALQPTKAEVTVDLTNTGSAAIKGKYTLALFADTTNSNQTLGTLTPIVSESETLATLAAGKSASVKVPLGKFPDVANGNYYVLAQASGLVASPGTNDGASSTTIAVTDPFIDLTGLISITSPKSRSIKGGQSFGYSVEVTNNGNVVAKGPLAINISNRTALDATPNFLGTLKETINLAPEAHITFNMTQKVPTDYAPGTYYLLADVDPLDTFNESNTANNTSISAYGLTIVSPFPNLVGTYSDIGKVTSGPEVDSTSPVTIVIASEGNDGSLTGTLTIGGASGALTGSVTTAGQVTTKATVGSETYTFTGTVKNNQFTGSFTSKDFNGRVLPAIQDAAILGIYNGTATTDAGQDKGSEQDLTIDILGEDIDGDLTGTVTTNGTSNFTGSINNTNGKFTITVFDNNDSTAHTTTLTGTEVDDDMLSGHFEDNTSDHDAGIFSASK